MKKLLFILLIVNSIFVKAQEHFPTQRIFDGNKASLIKKDWKVMTSQHFEVNFYGKNINTATYTAQLAETAYEKINHIIGFSPYERTKIFLYESKDDHEGIKKEIETKNLLDDKLNDSKINLIIEGTSKNFQQNLIKNIATIFVHDILYGGNVKDAIQNTLLLSVPEWFSNGLVSFILNNNEDINFAQDEKIINYLHANNFSKIDHLKNEEAKSIGHSMWHFIAEKYGKENISGILNLTRIIRNEKTSISSTLNTPFLTFVKEWRNYYLAKNENLTKNQGLTASNNNDYLNKVLSTKNYSAIKINSEGNMYGLMKANDNELTLTIYDNTKQKDSTLFKEKTKKKFKNPLFAWKNNESIALIYQKNETNFIQIIDTNIPKTRTNKLKEARKLNITGNILSFDIKNDELVVSIEKNGQIDIYNYNTKKETSQQLTNDAFDDLEPVFYGKTNHFLFISNRSKDSLNSEKASLKTIENQQAIFLHEGTANKTLVKKIYTSTGSVSNITTNNENEFYFIENAQEYNQLKKYSKVDSSIMRVWIGDKNIVQANYNTNKKQLFLQSSNNKYFQIENQLLNEDISIQKTPIQKTTPVVNKNSLIQIQTKSNLILKPGEVDTENYVFDENNINSTILTKSKWQTNAYSKTKTIVRQIRQPNLKVKGPTNFKNNLNLTSTDNGFQADPRGLGYKVDFTMNDQLDQYGLQIGAFSTFDLKNIDIYAGFNYNLGRLKIGPRIDRKSLYVGEENLVEIRTTNSKYAIQSAYIINQNTRFTLSPYYIYNKIEQINSPIANEAITTYAGIKSEFIFDNTTKGLDNRIKNGNSFLLKYKNNKSIKIKNQDFGRITADYRHYFNFGKDFILATRLYGQHSFGKNPKKILLGGMDNWISNKFNLKYLSYNGEAETDDIIENYFMIDLSTNLRGFELNKANGTNNLLMNIELRIPFAKYILNGDVTSKFLTNMQLVPFLDMGAVWTGSINQLNVTTIGSENVGSQIIKIKNYKDPYLLGLGLGLRTNVLGSYLKYDLAWGKEYKQFNKPISYITLGYEF